MMYAITLPYVSPTLSRTYHKRLEVLEGELISDYFVANKMHFYAKGKWQEKPHSEREYFRMIEDTVVAKLAHGNRATAQYLFFDDLDIAKASKILSIEKMGEIYTARIKELEESFKKNVPDVVDMAQDVKMNYPELFI